MHDIKYFFLNKNNQIIQMSKLPKTLPKNIIFQNPLLGPRRSAPDDIDDMLSNFEASIQPKIARCRDNIR
jgi:hypothetical protein